MIDYKNTIRYFMSVNNREQNILYIKALFKYPYTLNDLEEIIKEDFPEYINFYKMYKTFQ